MFTEYDSFNFLNDDHDEEVAFAAQQEREAAERELQWMLYEAMLLGHKLSKKERLQLTGSTESAPPPVPTAREQYDAMLLLRRAQ